MFFPVVRGSPGLDPGLRLAAIAFGPVIGLAGFAFTWWVNRDRIVQFSCDDTSFRFRKLGAVETETRSVVDIVRVQGMGRSGTTGYCIGFRDGTEACVSVGIKPGGPLLGEWFQTHLGKEPAKSSPPLSSRSEDAWHPPRELRSPTPRRVRFTNGGIALGLITIAAVLGGNAAMLSYARAIKGKHAEFQQRILHNRETEGVVTRLWKLDGRHPRFLVTYRYSAEGTDWDAPTTRLSKRYWESLQVGAPVSIVYTPGDPATSFPKDDPPDVPPLWLAWVIMPILTALGILPFVVMFRVRRYLVHGKTAPARVLSVSWRPGTTATVYYQFPLPDGTAREGSYVTANVPPPVDSVFPVLYDPNNPGRNTRYPVSFATPADG